MKNLSFYKEVFPDISTEKELFEKFRKTLIRTHKSYDFYVNWGNVAIPTNLEILLNSLNALKGKSNEEFDETFRQILKTIPKVIITFPYLLALSKNERDNLINGKASLEVLESDNPNQPSFKNASYDFSLRKVEEGLSDFDIEKYLYFFDRTGLKRFFVESLRCSLVDYVSGVLVGLDSNARKNRSGRAFELLCLPLISEVAKKFGLELQQQATLKNFGVASNFLSHLTVDFLLKAHDGKTIDIEVNFFQTAGSKPTEVVNSYIKRREELLKANIGFILISDGAGYWSTVEDSALERVFEEISFFMNYSMAAKGLLEKAVEKLLLTL